jgi:hypothetical protein
VTHRDSRVGQIPGGVECRTRGDESEVAERFKFVAQLVPGGHQHRFEGDHRGCAGFHGGISGDLDQPDRFDLAVRELGCR